MLLVAIWIVLFMTTMTGTGTCTAAQQQLPGIKQRDDGVDASCEISTPFYYRPITSFVYNLNI